MYACYNLSLPSNWGTSGHNDPRRTVTKIRFDAAVEEFMASEAVDAAALEDAWFGQGNFSVFISHSHADLGLANGLASRLELTLGLSCFVDSTVWGYADNLLRQIDERFCLLPNGQTFDYAKRNRSTSHVHMMLAAALAKVIDRCECVLFLNTPNSLEVPGGSPIPETIAHGKSHTASPWIYYELLATQMIERRMPRSLNESVTASLESRLPTFYYEAPTEHLKPLSQAQLELWLRCGERGPHALDSLYARVSPG